MLRKIMRFAILYYIYQNQSFTLPEYKLDSLSTYVNVVFYNTKYCRCYTYYSIHQKWKNNMKKKFIFIRYHDSCVDNKETNPGAHFSSLLINVNGALLSALKTCSDRYSFSSVVFLMVSGNLSATSWSEEGTSSITLIMIFSF